MIWPMSLLKLLSQLRILTCNVGEVVKKQHTLCTKCDFIGQLKQLHFLTLQGIEKHGFYFISTIIYP